MEANTNRRRSDQLDREDWYKHYHLMHSIVSKVGLPLSQISSELVASLFQRSPLAESIQHSLELIQSLCGAEGITLFLMDNCSSDLLLLDSNGVDNVELAILSDFNREDSFHGYALKSRHITRHRQLTSPTAPDLGKIPCAVTIPLLIDQQVIGMIDMIFDQETSIEKDLVRQLKRSAARIANAVFYGQYILRVLDTINDPTATGPVFTDSPAYYSARSAGKEAMLILEITIEQLNEKLINEIEVIQNQELTDQLTNLFDDNHFSNRLNSEMSREQRMRRGLSLISIGIDNLDKINSTYGRDIADEVVGSIGDVVRHQIRESDAAFRQGDDTLTILLRDTEESDAIPVISRIRSEIAALLFMPTDQQIEQISASFGVAQFRNRETEDSLKHRSKHAMGIARQLTADRVTTYSAIENEIINQLKVNRTLQVNAQHG